MKAKTTFSFRVYRQDPPVLVKDEFEINLVEVGFVTGSSKECWAKAYQLAERPVLEQVNVH